MREWVDLAAIKRQVSITQVLQHYHVRLKSVGREQLRGRCPLPTHRSEHSQESFQVHVGKNVWACHSESCCAGRQGKRGGNILDLVAHLEHCSIRGAGLRIQAWDHVQNLGRMQEELVSKGNSGVLDENRRPVPLTFSLSLGWHAYLEQRGIERTTAAWFGVGYYAGNRFLRGRIGFPLHDERGCLVGYAGRSVDGTEPRYLFPPGLRKSQVIFNLHRATEAAGRQGNWAIVVEGFFDCLKVHQAGYANVVALMGVSASERQSELLRTRFRKLVLMLDGDAAGTQASRALLQRWPTALEAPVPAGRQPDQLSSVEIQEILRRARAQARAGDG